MNKEEIVKIFKEIADKVESGEVTVYCKSAFTSMPFTTVIDYMEFIDKSELEFTYKSPFRRLSVGGTNSNESVSTLYAVL